MITTLTLLFGTVGYLLYKSKEEFSLFEGNQLDINNEQIEEDDLYKDLEDLFI